MKILYLHQYFNTPDMIGGTRSYEMARRFVAAGHEVEMVTSLRQEEGEAPVKGWKVTDEAGIKVHWLPVPYDNAMSTADRIKSFLRFAVLSCRKASELGCDVIFATSTPLTIAIPALYVKKRRRVPMVFEVRDLWPEAPIQMGALQNPVLRGLAKWLERTTYRNSTHVVALTPGMKEGVVECGYPADKVAMIPNSSDVDLFDPSIDKGEARKELGLPGGRLFSYFGTMGEANGLEYVLHGAKVVQDRGVKGATFVLVGRGKERPKLDALKEELGLNNVIIRDAIPKSQVPLLLGASDVCMTIFKNIPILQTCSPNKFFDTLAGGRPALVNMTGWVEGLVAEAQCGAAVRPDDKEDFADKVEFFLARSDAELEEMGRNARALAEREFSRDILAKRLLDVLEVAASRG